MHLVSVKKQEDRSHIRYSLLRVSSALTHCRKDDISLGGRPEDVSLMHYSSKLKRSKQNSVSLPDVAAVCRL
jgi:hypothetical protein